MIYESILLGQDAILRGEGRSRGTVLRHSLGNHVRPPPLKKKKNTQKKQYF